MRHLKIILLTISTLLLLPECLLGQSRSITVTIVDSNTNETLPGATALNLQSKEGFVSDARGIFTLSTQNEKDTFAFSYLGYNEKQIPFNKLTPIIQLDKNSNLLSEVTIVSNKVPEPITNKMETISDFVIDNDRIIMLAKRKGDRYNLKLTDLDGNALSRQELPKIKHIEELFTSCFGTHFLVGRFEVLQLHSTLDSIQIIDRQDRELFDLYIKSCKAQNEEYVYLERKTLKDQIASIMAYSKNSDEKFLFAGISDDENLMRYKHDAPYMNYADGTGPLHLGIHARDARDAMEWGDFLNSHFYVPVDYYMMSHNRNILIFDHEKLKLKTFDWKGELVKEEPIDYPNQKGWSNKKNMYVDQITKKLYTLHRVGLYKYFTEMDLNSGRGIHQYRVKAPFVENIAIHDGVIYFTNSSLTEPARILKKVILN